METGAYFTPDNKRRMFLFRTWNVHKPYIAYIGLNPSTAAQVRNDNTITKLIKITNNNGYGGFYMLNLFTQVSTDPTKLNPSECDPEEDFSTILYQTKHVSAVVACWGNFKEAQERAKRVVQHFPNLLCLEQNKNGSPKHPLYCLDKTILKPFNKDLFLK